MDPLSRILSAIPLFSHLTSSEMKELQRIGRLNDMKAGSSLDLSSRKVLAVVLHGYFEIEALGHQDILYFAPGSYFGKFPFAGNRHRGRVKALTSARLLLFEEEELIRFYLRHFKAMRATVRMLDRSGYSSDESGILKERGGVRVCMVHQLGRQSGASTVAVLLAEELQKKGETIVLDCTYTGPGIFDHYGERITDPLGQRKAGSHQDTGIIESIVSRKGADLLNLTHGSTVRLDPTILAPLLFLLSLRYRYVVIDAGSGNGELEEHIIAVSDHVLAVLKSSQEQREYREGFSSFFTDGQRLMYVINGYFSKRQGAVQGSFLFPSLGSAAAEPGWAAKVESIEAISEIARYVSRPYRGIIVGASGIEALALSGFIFLSRENDDGNLFYSSYTGFTVMVLSLLAHSDEELRSMMEKVFGSGHRRMVLPQFPDLHIFQSKDMLRQMMRIAGDARLEYLRHSLIHHVYDEESGDSLMCSTGEVASHLTASMLHSGIHVPQQWGDRQLSSGYPGVRAHVAHMLRSYVSETVLLTVRNEQTMRWTDERIPRFYRSLYENEQEGHETGFSLADHHHEIELNEKELKSEKIVDLSLRWAEKETVAYTKRRDS